MSAVERCLNRRGRSGSARPILVVEDDTPTREFIAELLSKHGYMVETAADGTEARARVATSLPELVILVLILPEVSGLQLLAEWRVDSRTADLPVFVSTTKDLMAQEKSYIRGTFSETRSVAGCLDQRIAAIGAHGEVMKRRILVIEDNAPNRELLSDRLEAEGFEVLSAENLEQAYSAFDNQPIDLCCWMFSLAWRTAFLWLHGTGEMQDCCICP